MPDTYTYQVRDRSGKMVSGTLAADSQELVVNRLREMGYVPLRVAVQRGAGVKREINILPQRTKLKDLAVFSRQFSAMVSAGLPILKALSILEQQTEAKLLKKTTEEVRLDIERGASLSSALAKHPKVFNDLYVAMVKSGETGGVLEAVLERLANNLEREVSLRHRIKSAMTYPVVVLGFVTLILMAMLLFIVPQFKSIYEVLEGSLPLPTLILLKVSDLVKSYFLLLLLAAGVAVYVVRRWKKTPGGKEKWDGMKLRVPVFGPLFLKTALARFARTLAILTRSGVPILQSLDVVAEAVDNAVIANAVLDVQRAVKDGETLGRPLARHQVFPPMVTQMIAVGEETGSLDAMLDKVAGFYDDEVTAAVDSLTAMIEPIMIFFVGGAVGLAVIALYLPMFNIINLIK
jgi:type IV pilus assembly protein PilC